MQFNKIVAILVGIILMTSPTMIDAGLVLGAGCVTACSAALAVCQAGTYLTAFAMMFACFPPYKFCLEACAIAAATPTP